MQNQREIIQGSKSLRKVIQTHAINDVPNLFFSFLCQDDCNYFLLEFSFNINNLKDIYQSSQKSVSIFETVQKKVSVLRVEELIQRKVLKMKKHHVLLNSKTNNKCIGEKEHYVP